MAERELLVRIIGDDRDLQRALNNTERKVSQIDGRMASFSKNAGRAFKFSLIGVGLSEGIRDVNVLVQASSDLNEQITRSEQVFGASADQVQNWSAQLASSFGVSQTAALEFAGTFGLLFHNIGIGEEESAKFSQQLVELASDLASFNNTTVDDALNALRSGLTGEIEPLRRYGVFLNEARSNQVALAESGKTSSKALTTQEKVLARLNIIMQDTSVAQGDFARTSDGLANKQRIAAAEAQNLAANVGSVLAPAMDLGLTATIGLTGGLNNLIGGLRDVRAALHDTTAFDGWNKAVEDASGGASDFFQGLADGIPIVSDLRDTVRDLNDAIADTSSFGQGIFEPGEGRLGGPASQRTEEQRLARERAAEGQRAIDRITRQNARAQSLSNQLADSEKRAAHLRDLIREDPSNERLQERLGDELDKQARLRQQIAIQAQQTADADRRSAQAQKDAADEAARRQRENQIAARNARQFKALGLTETGEQRVPGIEALRRRGRSLTEKLKDSGLDKDQIQRFTKRIAVIFGDSFDVAGREVRQAILDMFQLIATALGEGVDKLDKQGPLTKTHGLRTKKILEGLGLTPEQENELRGRLAKGLTNIDVAPSGGTSTTGTRPQSNVRGGRGGIVVENFVTVEIDGQKITSTVTKQQQKQRRRNPPQKRGPGRGRQ